MNKKIFSWGDRLLSFTYAFKGIKLLFQNEHNARIHLCAAVLAVASGVIFSISNIEWIALVFAIGLVFSLEAVNSAIEYISDHVMPEHNELIGAAKDVAAAAVLIAAITAVIVGIIIFLPYLLTFAANY